MPIDEKFVIPVSAVADLAGICKEFAAHSFYLYSTCGLPQDFSLAFKNIFTLLGLAIIYFGKNIANIY